MLVAATVILAACASTGTQVKQIDRLGGVRVGNPRILMMTPDIKYYLLTAGGMPKPHGEWTAAARRNFERAVGEYAARRGIDITMLEPDARLSETEIALQKLYSAVGTTILVNYFGNKPLPTKGGSFDWSLGPDVREIADRYGVDYALFSHYRDYQASGGRIAFAVMAAAVGMFILPGMEGGFAALVDLKTGDIVWFNLVTAGAGELRKEDGARLAVETLFENLPQPSK